MWYKNCAWGFGLHWGRTDQSGCCQDWIARHQVILKCFFDSKSWWVWWWGSSSKNRIVIKVNWKFIDWLNAQAAWLDMRLDFLINCNIASLLKCTPSSFSLVISSMVSSNLSVVPHYRRFSYTAWTITHIPTSVTGGQLACVASQPGKL